MTEIYKNITNPTAHISQKIAVKGFHSFSGVPRRVEICVSRVSPDREGPYDLGLDCPRVGISRDGPHENVESRGGY